MRLREIGEAVERLGGKCLCGYRFKSGDVRCYPHGGGVLVDDFNYPVWVYFHCPRCGYDMALWKILNRVGKQWTRGREMEVLEILVRQVEEVPEDE